LNKGGEATLIPLCRSLDRPPGIRQQRSGKNHVGTKIDWHFRQNFLQCGDA